VLEQLNQDLLNPLIDRTFNIMVRKGPRCPSRPSSQGQPLRVEYISIMAQAQKAVGWPASIASSTGGMKRKAIEPEKLVDNVGDPSQVERGQIKAHVIERRVMDSWAQQLETPEGRQVIWDIIEETGMFANAFGATDAETNHNTGRQSIGQFVVTRIHQIRPLALIEMMQENAKEKTL
jgi:hypothetical protein